MTEAAATSANGSQTAAGNGGAGAAGGAAATGAAASGTDTGNAAQQNQNGAGQGAQSGQPADAAAGADPYASLKAPAGFDAAALPKIAEVAKAYGLTPAAAQKLLDDTHAGAVKAKADMEAALAKQKSDWHAEILADKEIGGEAFKATMERAQKVIGEVDGKIAPGIKKILDDSGYGDHPAVVKLFAYLGKANREDGFHFSTQTPPAKKSAADVLYG